MKFDMEIVTNPDLINLVSVGDTMRFLQGEDIAGIDSRWNIFCLEKSYSEDVVNEILSLN